VRDILFFHAIRGVDGFICYTGTAGGYCVYDSGDSEHGGDANIARNRFAFNNVSSHFAFAILIYSFIFWALGLHFVDVDLFDCFTDLEFCVARLLILAYG
jgi:hypothetical protein